MEDFKFLTDPIIRIDFNLTDKHRFIFHINKGLVLFNELVDLVIAEVNRVTELDETCPGIQREFAEAMVKKFIFS